MACEENPGGIRSSSGWLTSGLVARVQAGATRLRVVLAMPALAVIALFTDRGPMWPGVTVALVGEFVQIWASAHLQKNLQIVRSGPYAWMRNPMYLGRFLVGLGLAVLTWRWFLILPYVVVFWVYAHARVLGEEARLQALFGDDHASYCRQVRRWLPWPPRGLGPGGRWSWPAVWRNHQLRVTMGVVVLLAALKYRLEAWGPIGWGP